MSFLTLVTSSIANIAAPSVITDGKPRSKTATGQIVNEGFFDDYDNIDTMKACVWSTAGSGVMVITVAIWGWLPAPQKWFLIKTLNAGAAIPETDADRIAYSEDVSGFAPFTRFYAQLTAIGGTATAISVGLAVALSRD